MLIYYVDWWDEEAGHLRRHFRDVGYARQYFRTVRRTSSGTTVLRKAELKTTKNEMIVTLNALTLGNPIDPYAGSTQIQAHVPTKKMMQQYEGEDDS